MIGAISSNDGAMQMVEEMRSQAKSVTEAVTQGGEEQSGDKALNMIKVQKSIETQAAQIETGEEMLAAILGSV